MCKNKIKREYKTRQLSFALNMPGIIIIIIFYFIFSNKKISIIKSLYFFWLNKWCFFINVCLMCQKNWRESNQSLLSINPRIERLLLFHKCVEWIRLFPAFVPFHGESFQYYVFVELLDVAMIALLSSLIQRWLSWKIKSCKSVFPITIQSIRIITIESSSFSG